jgi:hypothetical protein
MIAGRAEKITKVNLACSDEEGGCRKARKAEIPQAERGAKHPRRS